MAIDVTETRWGSLSMKALLIDMNQPGDRNGRLWGISEPNNSADLELVGSVLNVRWEVRNYFVLSDPAI